MNIDGNINLSDVIGINGTVGYAVMKKWTLFDSDVWVRTGISLLDGSVGYGITAQTLATTIKSASVSGSTLTLTTYSGSTINFSKPSTTPSWGTAGYVADTNNLPSGTKHEVNGLKTAIVNYRSSRGYIYFTITINGTRHVYYFADNGNGWTS